MEWITPKLNWTSEDYYNYWDLDRVENNTKVLADMLGIVLDTPIVTSRNYKSIPYSEVLNRVEQNIQKVTLFPIMNLKPLKTDWKYGDSFNWEDALRLEENLNIVYNIVEKNIKNPKYCGTFNCGEEVL